MHSKFAIVLLVLFLGSSDFLSAETWPSWRGPNGNGFTSETKTPVTWDSDNNIAWKVTLTSPGNSSPIVFGSQIYLTQADNNGRTRSLICFDTDSGAQKWIHSETVEELEPTHPTNPYCAASPVTDGKNVIAMLGSGGLVCCNTDGKLLWKKNLGAPQHLFGQGASPIIWQDLCIVNYGPGKEQFFAALKVSDGSLLWRIDIPISNAPNPFDQPDGPKLPEGATLRDPFGTWATAMIRNVVGQPDELILSLPEKIIAVDPRTGDEMWYCAGNGPQVISSPLIGSDCVGSLGSFAFVVKPKGKGDQIANRLWNDDNDRPRIGTGLIYKKQIITTTMQGVLECLSLETGDRLWHRRLSSGESGGATWSSLVQAGSKIYALDQSGTTTVFMVEPEFLQIGQNRLNEPTNSTPAISDGRIYIRTDQHLWCISEPN
jgi:outer membrane protein assembly factor BamB